ncbi:hypothetical protein DSECCO2_610010 [anaerobic digester metagenome]
MIGAKGLAAFGFVGVKVFGGRRGNGKASQAADSLLLGNHRLLGLHGSAKHEGKQYETECFILSSHVGAICEGKAEGR